MLTNKSIAVRGVGAPVGQPEGQVLDVPRVSHQVRTAARLVLLHPQLPAARVAHTRRRAAAAWACHSKTGNLPSVLHKDVQLDNAQTLPSCLRPACSIQACQGPSSLFCSSPPMPKHLQHAAAKIAAAGCRHLSTAPAWLAAKLRPLGPAGWLLGCCCCSCDEGAGAALPPALDAAAAGALALALLRSCAAVGGEGEGTSSSMATTSSSSPPGGGAAAMSEKRPSSSMIFTFFSLACEHTIYCRSYQYPEALTAQHAYRMCKPDWTMATRTVQQGQLSIHSISSLWRHPLHCKESWRMRNIVWVNSAQFSLPKHTARKCCIEGHRRPTVATLRVPESLPQIKNVVLPETCPVVRPPWRLTRSSACIAHHCV